MARNFRDLSEREILALAISLEEEDSRIYGEFADGLRERYPSSAAMFAPTRPASAIPVSTGPSSIITVLPTSAPTK